MAPPVITCSRSEPRPKHTSPRSLPLAALGGIVCPFPRAKPARGPVSWLHGALSAPPHVALLRAPAAFLFLLLLVAWFSGALRWSSFSSLFPASAAVRAGVARLQVIESLNERVAGGSAKRRDDVAVGGDVERRVPRKVGGKAYQPVQDGEDTIRETRDAERSTRKEENTAEGVEGVSEPSLTKQIEKAEREIVLIVENVTLENGSGADKGVEAGEQRDSQQRSGDRTGGRGTNDASSGSGGKGGRSGEEEGDETSSQRPNDGSKEQEEAESSPSDGEDDEGQSSRNKEDNSNGFDNDRIDKSVAVSDPTGLAGSSSGATGGNSDGNSGRSSDSSTRSTSSTLLGEADDVEVPAHAEPDSEGPAHAEPDGAPDGSSTGHAPSVAAQQDPPADVADHSNASPSSQTLSLRGNGNSQPSPSVARRSCDGRRVYVYAMPPVFNDDIVRTACDNSTLAWLTCPAFLNRAQGPRLPADRDGGRALVAALLEGTIMGDAEGGEAGEVAAAADWDDSRWAWLHRWYNTEQHQLEAVWRERLERHPCRTEDDTEADVFFVPAYVGWNVYKNDAIPGHMPHPGQLLKEFLLGQPVFQRTRGARHVLVLGRAIWDFAGTTDLPPHYNVIFVPELANITFLTVEQPPYPEMYPAPTVSVPYTTNFHPESLAEVNAWRALVASRPRPFLFSYVGGRRPDSNKSGPLRKALIAACEGAGVGKEEAAGGKDGAGGKAKSCLWMKCTGSDEVGLELPLFTAVDAERVRGSALGEAVEAAVRSGAPGDAEGEEVAEWVPSGCYDPWQVAVVMLQSRFCLQPTGDSDVRRSTFDSLIAGCIPVFFKEESFNMQYKWHFPEDRSGISVTLEQGGVLNGTVDVAAELAKIPEERVAAMQANMRELVPHLLYRHLKLEHVVKEGNEAKRRGGVEGGEIESGDEEWRDAFDVSFDKLIEEMRRREGK